MNILFFLKSKNTVTYLFDDNSIEDGLRRLSATGFTAIPVISRDGIYVGTITEGDFLRYKLSEQYNPEAAVSSIIRKGFNPPVYVTAAISELLVQLMEQNFVPVTDDRGCFTGIITRRDIIGYLINRMDSAGLLSQE